MKTLIVYYSYSGHNELVASELSVKLDADILRITETRGRGIFRIMLDLLFDRRPKINPLRIDWNRYDHIVLMAPIWNLQIAHPMKSFIEKQARSHLQNYSFITMCTGRDGQEESIREQLEKMIGHPPLAIQEIRMIDLLPPEKQKDTQAIAALKLTEKTLQEFTPQIEQFTEKIKAAERV